MSPYRFQYNESESDIQNFNFLYKNTKKAKTLSKTLKKWKVSKIQIVQKPNILFCILYTFHNSYFLLYFLIWEKFEKSKIFKFLFCVMYMFNNSYFYNYYIIYFYIYIFYMFIFRIFVIWGFCILHI